MITSSDSLSSESLPANSLLPAIIPTPVVALPAVEAPSAPPAPVRSLEIHPAALLFPPMQGPDLGALVEDIEANGLREPIVTYQGLILDGRNRMRACELAQVEPRFVEWDGVGSPLAFVLSRNLHRRHLNESQRSIIAARAKVMFEDEAAERKAATQFGEADESNTGEGEDDEKSRETTVFANLQRPHVYAHVEAAELLNISPRSVSTAAKVLESGDEQVIAAVESGNISVSDAASVAELPKEEQRQALEAVRAGRARTLRQAADVEPDDDPPQTPKGDDDPEPPISRNRLRVECRRFSDELDKLLRRLDTVTSICGGPNDYTKRVRDCLTVALRAIHDCVSQFGKAR